MITRTSSIEEVDRAGHIFSEDQLKLVKKTIMDSGYVVLELTDSGINVSTTYDSSLQLSPFKDFFIEVTKKLKGVGIVTKKLTVDKDIATEDSIDLVKLRQEKEELLKLILPIQEKIEKLVAKHKDLTLNLTSEELLAFKDFDGSPVEYYLTCTFNRKEYAKNK